MRLAASRSSMLTPWAANTPRYSSLVAIGQRGGSMSRLRVPIAAARRQAAPEPGPFLVGPSRRAPPSMRRDAVGGQRAEQLQPGHHAEGAVERAVLRDAVEAGCLTTSMASVAPGRTTIQVAGGVGVHLDRQRAQVSRSSDRAAQRLRRPRQAPRALDCDGRRAGGGRTRRGPGSGGGGGIARTVRDDVTGRRRAVSNRRRHVRLEGAGTHPVGGTARGSTPCRSTCCSSSRTNPAFESGGELRMFDDVMADSMAFTEEVSQTGGTIVGARSAGGHGDVPARTRTEGGHDADNPSPDLNNLGG